MDNVVILLGKVFMVAKRSLFVGAHADFFLLLELELLLTDGNSEFICFHLVFDLYFWKMLCY
jgi:hypothetical protein